MADARFKLTTLIAASALVVGAGCGKPQPLRGSTQEISTSQRSNSRTLTEQGTQTARRAQLLNRIRAADPQQETIERALLNERNELGLVLSRRTNLDDVPKLMRVMLAEMDKSFPGQNHTIVAYAPTNPPRPIGTARLDARTRDMTYTPATPSF